MLPISKSADVSKPSFKSFFSNYCGQQIKKIGFLALLGLLLSTETVLANSKIR
jgi:hypothetical protein